MSSPRDLEARITNYFVARTTNKPRDWEAHLRRWPIYAAATGAALAMATNADAGIITGFSGTTITVPRNLGVNHNSGLVNFGTLGHMGLYLSYRVRLYGGAFSTQLRSGAAVVNQGLFVTGGGGFLRRFNTGAGISAGMTFHSALPVASQFADIYRTHSRFGGGGNFASGQTGIAGIQVAGYIGWIQLKWNSSLADGYPDKLEALNWAINTTAPGQGILAGQDNPYTAPEPGTAALSLLALGAIGIAAWRKHRNASAPRPGTDIA